MYNMIIYVYGNTGIPTASRDRPEFYGPLLLSTEANDGQFLRNLGEFAVKQPHQNRLEL